MAELKAFGLAMILTATMTGCGPVPAVAPYPPGFGLQRTRSEYRVGGFWGETIITEEITRPIYPPEVQDAIHGCVEHLNSLRQTAKTQQVASSIASFASGAISVGSGTTSALLKADEAKTGFAIAAAVGAGFALFATVVGDASKTLISHSNTWSHYAKMSKLWLERAPASQIVEAALECMKTTN